MQTTSNTKRIAKNTIMLYFRQILIMLVSLYTVRVVLNVLGAEDYGIYNVVAGVVTMFSFLSGAMATASQRYFSFDIGKKDTEHLKVTFSVTFQIYVILGILVILLAETIGLWGINHKLVIPSERLNAANWIFQAAVVSFLLTLITTPYMASIIAHENMNVYAYVSIVEAVLKLGIVFLLKVLPYDKLIVYGVLLTAVALVNTFLYRLYCYKHYDECKFRFIRDKNLFKEIVSYSGWNLFGAVSGVIRNQGLTIILNLFFSPIIVAARSISVQINTTLSNFGNNFITAIKPGIIKDYAADNKEKIIKTVTFSSKFVFCLLSIIVCPLFVKMDFLLNIWLKEIPEYTVIFSRLVIIEILIESLSYPVQISIQATGIIKKYQVIVGSILLLNIPISYIILHFYNNAIIVYIVSFILVIIANLFRYIIMRQFYFFNLFTMIFSHFKLIIPMGLLISILMFMSNFIEKQSIVINCLEMLIIVIITFLLEFLLYFSKDERNLIKNFLHKRTMV